MTIQRADILNALDTRAQRGYRSSTEDELADELQTREQAELRSQLHAAEREGEIRATGRDAHGAPRYELTRDGERSLVEGLNARR